MVKKSVRLLLVLSLLLFSTRILGNAWGDSVNSPNITLNVDTNRSAGAGAGNTAVTVNTITVAETMLPEYSSGTGKAISLKARPGFQFVSSSNVTAQSTTIGINGGGVNVAASVAPTGAAEEVLTFNLTSGTNSSVQDIIRINGVKLKILSAAGAAGPAQTTLSLTTATAGGAFTNQGIVAATIQKGAADRLAFSVQPGANQAGEDLLPAVKIVDFGGNIITNDSRTITLALSTNPGAATLLGLTERATASGVATWATDDDLRITTAAAGYVLQASHSGSTFLTSDTVNSAPFTITSGDPGSLAISTAPANTPAGDDILIDVTVLDDFDNPVSSAVDVTLEAAVNPGGWPLLVDTSLTKSTVSGVASWGADDNLRITKAIAGYRLVASAVGIPVFTSSFDITAGSASVLRFVEDPTDVVEGKTMSPAPSVEIIDAFGNRVDSSATVELTLSDSSCGGTITGGSAVAVSGLATFSSLSLDTPCSDTVLVGSVSGVPSVTSESFVVHAADAVPIALNSAQLKRNKLFRFSARGTFAVSTVAIDDPTKKGATLSVTGTTGSVQYKLPKSGWRKVNGGFQYAGAKCESVVLKESTISAVCRGKTGTIAIPEAGPVDIVLAPGKGTARFCGQCGGTAVGNESKIFKRSNCAAPDACP